ncbi:MAG: 3-isopropylmalate dehydratase small subunit [Treponema sp.]|jgi:3-isopropylmalate/(R)-2-methylmalate dehydratase small subunit|nr:3-isopropylmalate dehydratase small subunit [Treponema sp.]
MKTFGGTVLFLDRNDINTDEIIPAKYLNESSKEALKPNLLEDLRLEGFDPRRDIAGKGAVLSRSNFGCGSSREHAPWALEMNGINIVIAESFARIFRQNMYNCGMIAAELPRETLDELFRDFAGKAGGGAGKAGGAAGGGAEPTTLSVDIEKALLIFRSGGREKRVPFTLEGFERALVEAGGWVEYAARRY